MPKYYVEWPVEKVRSITVEADSEEEALERAMDPALLSDEEILTMYESSSGKERWKRARVYTQDIYEKALKMVKDEISGRRS